MNMIPHSRGDRSSKAPAAWLAGAAALAATASWVAWQARRAERSHPPAGRYVYIDGVRLHYVVRGEGPPLVLVHGNTVTQSDFEGSGLAERLARNHQVIAFDRPGFGHSGRPRDRLWTPTAQADLLHRACVALGIHQPVVLGHSLGAMVALAWALNHPTHVARLVLVSGYYYPTARLDALLMAPVATPVLGDVMRYTVSALASRLGLGKAVESMFAPQPVAAGFYAAVPREMMLRPVQLRAAAQDAAFMVPEARRLCHRYAELRMPVTVVAGAADKVVDPQAHSVRLHDDLPNSRLVLVPDAGHMVHYAAGEQLAEALRDVPLTRTASTLAEATTPASPQPFRSAHADMEVSDVVPIATPS